MITTDANEALVGEMQARWATAVLMGRVASPTEAEVADFSRKRAERVAAVDPAYRDARSNLVVMLRTAAAYGLASNEEYHAALVDALEHETGDGSQLVKVVRGSCDCCGKLEPHIARLVDPELFGGGTYAEYHNTTAAPVKKLLKCSKCNVASMICFTRKK